MLLHHLELVAVRAAVLVERHALKYTDSGDSASRRCQSGAVRYHLAAVRIAIVTDYYYPQLGGITEHVDGQAPA